MIEDGIRFGIRTEDGTPYVLTCRGMLTFDTVDEAAGFIACRAKARLASQRAVWNSFEPDVERWQGARATRQSRSDPVF